MKNLERTEYSYKPMINESKISTKQMINFDPSKKNLIQSFSCTNYYPKTRKIPIFLRTINNFNYDKLKNIGYNNFRLKRIKLKKSSSAIFQSNDVDLVRNLNFDSVAQYSKNNQLRESIISTLKGNENDKKKKEKQKQAEEVNLPKLSKLAKYKSYEIIQSHNKKIKTELSEQLQKELFNKLKYLRNECQAKKMEKEKIFEKIRKIEEELDEIDAENHYFKEQYRKQLNDISKKRKDSPEKKMESFRSRYKVNFDKKNKKNNNKNNLMDIFKVEKKEKNKSRNNISQDLNISNMRNESPKQSEKFMNNKLIVDINSSKVNEQKKLESFEINMLQNQRKKEYDTFQKQQDDKIYNLKKEKIGKN